MASKQLLTGLVAFRVLGGSQGILPRLRSAQVSAYLQGRQGAMAETCPYSITRADEAQILMLCLSVSLKAYLCEMRDSTEMKTSCWVSMAYEPSSERPKTNFYLT